MSIFFFFFVIGEIKGLAPGPGGKPRDLYVSVLLDREELYRTTTIEKTVKSVLTMNAVIDCNNVLPCLRIGSGGMLLMWHFN